MKTINKKTWIACAHEFLRHWFFVCLFVFGIWLGFFSVYSFIAWELDLSGLEKEFTWIFARLIIVLSGLVSFCMTFNIDEALGEK